MIGIIKNLWQERKAPKVLLEPSVDHVEVAEDYMMLGLNLEWKNETVEALQVSEVQVTVFPNGRKKDGIRFYAHGHFTRNPMERVIKKVVGPRSFLVPPEEMHIERLRVMTRAVLDLPEGVYPVQIQSSVTGGTYVHDTKLEITNRLKYRTTDAWD